MSRWNNSNCGFQKGHKGFRKNYLPHSEDTKQKMSKTKKELLKVYPHLGFQKGHKPVAPFKKGHLDLVPPESRQKAAQKNHRRKGKPNWYQIRNVQHPSWIDGRSKDKEYIKRRCREHYRKSPRKKWANQRRQSLKKAVGPLTIQTIQKVYEDNIKEFGTLTCIYCFSNIQFGNDSLEHIIPLTKKGTNKYYNLAIACRKCNISKNNKLLEEWIC